MTSIKSLSLDVPAGLDRSHAATDESGPANDFRIELEEAFVLTKSSAEVRNVSAKSAADVKLLADQAKQKYLEYVNSLADPAVLQAEVDRFQFQVKMRKWEAHFAKCATELKENYYDWYITLDYENGNYTTGPTRAASKSAFEEKYGARDRAYTGHIGTA